MCFLSTRLDLDIDVSFSQCGYFSKFFVHTVLVKHFFLIDLWAYSQVTNMSDDDNKGSPSTAGSEAENSNPVQDIKDKIDEGL